MIKWKPFILIWLGTSLVVKLLHPDTNESIRCVAWAVSLFVSIFVCLPFYAAYLIFFLSEEREKSDSGELTAEIDSQILLMIFYIVSSAVGFFLGLIYYPKMELGNGLTFGVLFPILGVPVLAGLAALISYIKRSIGR